MKNLLHYKDNDDVFVTNRRYNKIKYYYKLDHIFNKYTHYPNIEGMGIIRLLHIYIEAFNNKKYDLFIRKYKKKIKYTRLHCSMSYLIDNKFIYIVDGILKINPKAIFWKK